MFFKAAGGVLGAVCLGLNGCAYAPGVSNQAVAFNEAVADSTNKILLLNALRARERMPTYYTRTTGDTANAGLGPSVSFAIPLGPNASARGYGSGVSVGGSSQHLVAMQNLDDRRFMNGVLAPLKLEVLEFYMGQNWPAEVLFTLTVGRISLKRADADALIDAFDAQCRANPAADYCNASLPDGVAQAGGPEYLSSQLHGCLGAATAGGRLNLRNYPSDPQGSACFQAMLRVIVALGPSAYSIKSYDLVADGMARDRDDASTISDLSKTDLVIGQSEDKTRYVVCRKSTVTALKLARFGGEGASAFITADGDTTIKSCGGKAAKEIAPGHHAIEIQFATRSLDGMIYYLGELMRAGDTPVSQIWVWSGSQHRFTHTRLFSVVDGKAKGAPVSVKFRGHQYSIPASDSSHRSLQVVALLNQVWGLQKEQAETPSAAAVIVGG
ncbi:MAG: hypothetical protein ACXW3D_06640 [Caulobacteraceae bacterium]